MIIWKYQSIKTFLVKVMFQIGSKKFLLLKKVKNTVPWAYLIDDLNGEEIIGTFYQKELQRINQK